MTPNKGKGWVMEMTLTSTIPIAKAKSLYERLSPKEKIAYGNWYKVTHLLFNL